MAKIEQNFELPQLYKTKNKSRSLLLAIPVLTFFALIVFLLIFARSQKPAPFISVTPTPTPSVSSNPIITELNAIRAELVSLDTNQPGLSLPQVDLEVNFDIE